jgi:hypothetical protein
MLEERAEHAPIEIAAAGHLPDARARAPRTLRVADAVQPRSGGQQRAVRPRIAEKRARRLHSWHHRATSAQLVDPLRELLDVRAVHDQRRTMNLLRLGMNDLIAARGLRHSRDRLIAELERLLHDRRVNRTFLDPASVSSRFVEGHDRTLPILPASRTAFRIAGPL